MGVCKVVLFYTCAVVLFGGSCDGGRCDNDLTEKSAAVRLSNDLFCAYNKNVRPVMNQSSRTTVKTKLYILNAYMNEKWNILQLAMHLTMEWKDEFLVWDPSKYDNVTMAYEDSPNIWVPDIISYNTGFNGDNYGDMSNFLPTSTVSINSTGIVKYNNRVTLNCECSTDIAKWPFDSHGCIFFIGSPVYNSKRVNFSFAEGYYNNLNHYTPDREWKIDDIKQVCLPLSFEVDHHCLLKYDINIVRFSAMYYSSIVIPAVVLSLMRTLTFLMGHEPTFRIIILCLVFISELMYIQFLDTKLPNNGDKIVYIIQLYRNSLIVTGVALVVSVISDALYKHGTGDFPSNGPEWLKSALKFLLNKKPIAMLTNFNNRGAELLIERNVEEETPSTQRDENAWFWKTLSIFLDCLSFLFILMISLIHFWLLIP